jgi:DNA-binding PadR family transcriptional regulator
VYLVLSKLQEDGLVRAIVHPYDREQRRMFELTDAGKEAARR